MGTIIFAFLVIINVFKIGYMRPYKEPTWNTYITVKSNTAIGVMIFTVPDNGGFGKLQADIYLCNTSDYFEMVFRNQCEFQARCSSMHTLDTHYSIIFLESSTSGEIIVKTCLPDEYNEVLHLCSEYDRTGHGNLRITMIPFWHRRFRRMDVKVMVTEKYKKDDIIDITTNSSISGCTTWQPGCSIASVNSYKHFWFSSGTRQVFTNVRGINFGFSNTLKVNCPDKNKLKIFPSLSYKGFYARIRLRAKHIRHVILEDVSLTTHLQTTEAISGTGLRKFPKRNANVIFKLISVGNSINTKKLPIRLKRCLVDFAHGRKKRCVGIVDEEETVTIPAASAQMSVVTSGKITTASTKAASTQSMSTVNTQATTPPITKTTSTTSTINTKANTLALTIPTTKGTTPSIPLAKTTTKITTPSTTTQTIATTSLVSSTKLNDTHAASLPITSSSTRISQATTLSIITGAPSTRLTTTARITSSTTPSTTITTLLTIIPTIPLAFPSTSFVTHSNLPNSTSKKLKTSPSSMPLTSISTTTMNTATISTLCPACNSKPVSTSSTQTSQHSLGTTLYKTTISEQTSTAKWQPSKVTKLTTISPRLAFSTEVETPIYDTTTPFIVDTSSKIITSTTANTVVVNTALGQSTISFDSTQAITSHPTPVTSPVIPRPRVLTTTGTSTSATSPGETNVAPIKMTITLLNAEQVSSSTFFDTPLNVAFVSTLAGFTAIGSLVVIISYIRSKKSETENNRTNGVVDISMSTSSSLSSTSLDKSRCSGSSIPSSSTAFNSTESNLTPVVSEYDQEISQSQTADNPLAPRGRATQPSRDTRKTN